mgnify:CR=1 FL=1
MVYRRTERGEARYYRRRTEIIAAAKKLFTENGYEATTMQDVVRKASTSIGNCYFYFSNKESLLLVVVKDIIAEAWNSLHPAFSNVSGVAVRLGYALYQNITLLLEHKHIGRLMLRALSLPAIKDAVLDEYWRRVKFIADESPELFNHVDVDLKIHAAQGAGLALVEMNLMNNRPHDPVQVGFFYTRYVLNALDFPKDIVEETMKTIGNAVAPKHRLDSAAPRAFM